MNNPIKDLLYRVDCKLDAIQNDLDMIQALAPGNTKAVLDAEALIKKLTIIKQEIVNQNKQEVV